MQVTDFNSLQNFLRDKSVFQQYDLNRIGVFGSFARGEKFKDLDLLVEGNENDFKKFLALKNYLETELKLPVDIMIEKFADPIIIYRARKDMKYVTRN